MAEPLVMKLGWSAFSLLFVAVGVFVMKKGWDARARSGRIASTETTAIRDIEPGAVEVKGTARPGEDGATLESPFSKTPALAWTVEVEEYDTSGEHNSWDTIYETRAVAPIRVDDGTGEVAVDPPADAELNLDVTRNRVGAGDEPPAAVTAFVENEPALDEATRHQIGPLSVGDKRRYSEGVIEPGESVYVLGTARRIQGDWGDRDYAIDEPTPDGDFVLSDKSESELVSEGRMTAVGLVLFGGVFTAVGGFFTVLPWVVW